MHDDPPAHDATPQDFIAKWATMNASNKDTVLKNPDYTDNINDTILPTFATAADYIVAHVPWDLVFKDLREITSEMRNSILYNSLNSTLNSSRTAYKKIQDETSVVQFHKYFISRNNLVSANCSYRQMTTAFPIVCKV